MKRSNVRWPGFLCPAGLVLLLLTAAGVGGCGLKDDLFLPEPAKAGENQPQAQPDDNTEEQPAAQ